MNGLIAEPGWRWPLVARLNGPRVEVGAADHRLDLARLVVDRHQRGARPDAGQPAGDRLLRGRLELGVDRRLDLEAAAEHQPRPCTVEQLPGHPAREVGLLGVRVGRVDLVLVGHRLAHRLLVLGGVIIFWSSMRDSTRSRRCGAAAGCSSGSYMRRRRDHPGEQRRLGRRQPRASRASGSGSSSLGRRRRLQRHAGRVGGALRLLRLVAVAEVGPRGRLDAVGAVAEVDGVQVLGEDLLLRPLALEVVGERRLAQLLEHRAVALGGRGRSSRTAG